MSGKRKIATNEFIESLDVDDATKRYMAFNEIDALPREIIDQLSPHETLANHELIDMFLAGNFVPLEKKRSELKKDLGTGASMMTLTLDSEGLIKLRVFKNAMFLVSEAFDQSQPGTPTWPVASESETDGEECTQIDS